MHSMIVMLDSAHKLDDASAELGAPVEQLLTPLTRYKPQKPEAMFAIDNGAYSGFDRMAFDSLLYRERPRQALCRWVAVPDVVGSARRTLEVFNHWSGLLRADGWPLAFVVQDGVEDLPIPWWGCNAVFIGGTTAFKMSEAAVQVIGAAQAIGHWVHVGRVNTPGRFEYFQDLGVNSIDGTGLSRYSWMRKGIHDLHLQPKLIESPAAAVGG